MRTYLYRLIAVLLVLPLLVVADVTSAAAAPAPVTGQLVQERPASGTPGILDGRALSITRVGDTMIVGGTFTSARSAGSGTTLTRNRLLAFNVNTGQIQANFDPEPDNQVNSVIPGPDGTVYVGGEFNNIGGVARRRVAQLNVSDGSVVTAFNAGTVAGPVHDLKLYGDHLFVGGNFTHIANQAQLGLATVNATTGVFDPYTRHVFAGTQNGGYTGITHFDISPQAHRLLAIGNFATVDGASRRQVVVLDLGASSTSLANWQTSFYESSCNRVFNSYMRDLDISPDGSFAVISTTGAYGGSNSACDQTSRFEMDSTGTGLQPSWTDYTGGDTTYAVEITDSVVYTGGHARWQNNPGAGDKAGPGAVSRPGIAALDPDNGMPYTWNATRARGVGVFDFRFDDKGLWVVSDTELIGPLNESRPRVALLPPNGTTFTKPVAAELPNDVYSMQPGQDLVRRHVNGNSIGPVADAPDLSNGTSTLKGAFMLNGDLFSAWSNQAFVRQSFDGSSYGSRTSVDTHNQLVTLTDWNSDLSAATSMTYQRGRIYYTLPGNANLYYRYFTPENNVVGAKRYTASGSVGGLSFSGVRGMFLSDNALYTTDASGNLRRTQWNDGPGPSGAPVPDSTTNVSGPDAGDGRTWTGPLFLFQDGQGQPAGGPPSAAFTSDCTSRSCSFDASSSSGDVASYAWDFGDGQSDTGVQPDHDYTTDGNFSVTLTVTSSTGATSSVTHSVEVARVNVKPTAAFTQNCDQLACDFNSSGSSDSDGTIASRSWTFGDGGTSSAANPSHTYSAADTYSVSLTVTDNDGGTDTVTKSVDVSNQRVSFVGTDSSNGNRTVASVQVPGSVQAGDLLVLGFTVNNSTATVTPPSGWTQRREVDQQGTHGLLWTRTAQAGDAGSTVTVGTDFYSKSDLALSAYRSSTGATQLVSSAIDFDASSSTTHTSPQVDASTEDTWLVTYFAREDSSVSTWEPVSGQTTRTNNTGAGGGNVSATLVDSDGPVGSGPQGGLTGTLSSAASNVVTWSLRVGTGAAPPPPANVKPTAAFTNSCDALACDFNSSGSSDSDGTIASRSWTFGDGGTSSAANPSHTFTSPGTYEVNLTVTDDDGATDTATKSLTVNNQGVAFVGTDSSNGNRTVASVQVPSSVQAGDLLVLSFTVNNSTATVTPPSGWTEERTVDDRDTRGFLWTRAATGPDAGSTVTVTTSAYSKSDLALAAYRSSTGTAQVVSSAMDFDASSSTTHTSPQVDASTESTWLVTYFARENSSVSTWEPVSGQTTRTNNTGAGGGNVSATLVDSGGPVSSGPKGGLTGTLSSAASNVVTWSLRVGTGAAPPPPANVKPTAAFTNSCDALACDFNSSGSSDSDGTIASRSWTFGDGGTSSAANPSHTFTSPGTYEVNLTVTDDDGATDTATKSLTVNNQGVAFVGTDSSNGNRTVASVQVPSSVQAGDLLVLSFTVNNSTATVTPPSGWTEERTVDDRDTRGFLWTRAATGPDAGSTVTVTTSAYSKSDLALAAYRSSTGTAQVVSSAMDFDASSSTTHTSPQVDASTESTWLVTYFARENSSVSTWEPVSGQTTRTNNTGAGGGNVSAILVDSGGPVSSGPKGGLTGTLSSAAGNVVTWSLRVGTS